MPEALAAKIVERADGVPLFVEELARAVIEAQGSREGVERALSRPRRRRPDVPAALHASLMARLDRLGPMAREVTQIGAVIGRDFTYELLAPVAGRSEAELADALGRLADAGLVFSAARRRKPPTCSSTRWCAMSACAACCAAAGKSFMRTSPRSWKHPLRRQCRGAAGAARPSPHGGRPRRAGSRILASRRRAGGRALGQCRSRRAFRPRH